MFFSERLELLNQPIRFLSFPAYPRNRQDKLGKRFIKDGRQTPDWCIMKRFFQLKSKKSLGRASFSMDTNARFEFAKDRQKLV